MNGHENKKSSDPPNIVKAESLGGKPGLALTFTQRVSENLEF